MFVPEVYDPSSFPKDLLAHDEICTRKIIACKAGDTFCNWKGPRKDVEEHASKCLYYSLKPAIVHFTRLLNNLGAMFTLLDQSKMQLRQFPEQFAILINLRTLDLQKNEIVVIPKEIGNLVHLEELLLNDNKIEEVPSEIGNLRELLKLLLSDNVLRSLPEEIGSLTSLKTLGLYGNPLNSFPKSVEKLTCLTRLHLPTSVKQRKDLPFTIDKRMIRWK